MSGSTRRVRVAASFVISALGFALVGSLSVSGATADGVRPLPSRAVAIADPGAAPDSICGEILAHQRFKAAIADRPVAERRRLHEAMGIAFGDADSATVAMYVRERLGDAEIDALANEGVLVNRGVWVPPVPGRHAHGFHLARMEYASIDRVRGDARFVRVASTEFLLEPTHDIALDVVNIAALQNGGGAHPPTDPPPHPPRGPFLGAGVTVTVADSGVDLTHPDLPTPIAAYDVTTGDWEPDWSTDVANTVIWHGTHVTGTVVGSGVLSSGNYAGGAPAASLIAHKIGNDSNGSSTYDDMIKSVLHAASVGSNVYTVSYGGWDTYLDGSSPLAQAFDAAFAAGTLCFTSAGNSAARKRHYSVELAPGTDDVFVMFLGNGSSQTWTLPINLRVIWRDDETHDDHNMALECLDLGEEESLQLAFVGTSPRQTEAQRYVLQPNVAPNSSRLYTFRLTNTADSGTAPLVHVYQVTTNAAQFPAADPLYTVGSPADADTVLAVGAWVHRNEWVDFTGTNRGSGQPLGNIATFSSRGPRIDGLVKPDIVAPGSMTISLRDGVFANATSSTISNNGVNDGNGPANYYTAHGTSMAAPLAAAGGVLLHEVWPNLTAAQIRHRLTSTASHASAPTTAFGYGMIDILAAIAISPADLNGDGVVDGADLGSLLASWGECVGCAADLNGDSIVDDKDLALLLLSWSP